MKGRTVGVTLSMEDAFARHHTGRLLAGRPFHFGCSADAGG